MLCAIYCKKTSLLQNKPKGKVTESLIWSAVFVVVVIQIISLGKSTVQGTVLFNWNAKIEMSGCMVKDSDFSFPSTQLCSLTYQLCSISYQLCSISSFKLNHNAHLSASPLRCIPTCFLELVVSVVTADPLTEMYRMFQNVVFNTLGPITRAQSFSWVGHMVRKTFRPLLMTNS